MTGSAREAGPPEGVVKPAVPARICAIGSAVTSSCGPRSAASTRRIASAPSAGRIPPSATPGVAGAGSCKDSNSAPVFTLRNTYPVTATTSRPDSSKIEMSAHAPVTPGPCRDRSTPAEPSVAERQEWAAAEGGQVHQHRGRAAARRSVHGSPRCCPGGWHNPAPGRRTAPRPGPRRSRPRPRAAATSPRRLARRRRGPGSGPGARSPPGAAPGARPPGRSPARSAAPRCSGGRSYRGSREPNATAYLP